MSSDHDPSVAVEEEQNPWPNGAEHGLYTILTVGINKSGHGAGEIDFAINTCAVARMVKRGRKAELLKTLGAVLQSVEDA